MILTLSRHFQVGTRWNGPAGWLLFAFLPALTFAQNNTGELRLAFKDNSGAAVSARAELVNQATKTQQQVDLPDSGRYTFKSLPFGRYVVSVNRSGFSTSSEIVEINSAVPSSIQVTLAVQTVQTSVEVKDSETLLDTDRTAVAYYTGSHEIAERPSKTPGRGLIDLAALQPGWTRSVLPTCTT
jgi:hypothetical protein